MPPIVLNIRAKVSEWTVPRPRKLRFFTVPIDIRYQIYKLVLIDPVLRWDKRHKLNCLCKTFNPTISEPPPFLMMEVNIDEKGVSTASRCDCAKRGGMNLLLANRQAHDEAAPIFWSRNTFCCLAGLDLIGAIDHVLRPQTLTWIKHISIMNPDYSLGASGHIEYLGTTRQNRDKDMCESLFWDSVSRLSSLSSLQVPPYLIPTSEYDKSLKEAWVSNPELKIEMLGLISFCYDFDVDFRGSAMSGTEEYCLHYETIYVQTVRPLDITPSPASGSRGFVHCSSFEHKRFMELILELETVVKSRFFGADPNYLANWHDFWKIPDGFDEFNDQCSISVALEGSLANIDVPIKFYGLPSSKQTEARRAQENAARDAEQRAINGLTVVQNRVHETSRERKRVRRHYLGTYDPELWKRCLQCIHSPWIIGTIWDTRGNPPPQPLPGRIEAADRKAEATAKRKSEKSNAKARKIERKRVQGKGP